jgi:hypothetical protein
MLGVDHIIILRDALGTAEGHCLHCGAYLSVTIPSDKSAAEELSRLLNKHLVEKHADLSLREGG